MNICTVLWRLRDKVVHCFIRALVVTVGINRGINPVDTCVLASVVTLWNKRHLADLERYALAAHDGPDFTVQRSMRAV